MYVWPAGLIGLKIEVSDVWSAIRDKIVTNYLLNGHDLMIYNRVIVESSKHGTKARFWVIAEPPLTTWSSNNPALCERCGETQSICVYQLTF